MAKFKQVVTLIQDQLKEREVAETTKVVLL